MPSPEDLRRQAEAVGRVRAARVQRDAATDRANKRLKRAILDALSLGASVRDVATAAELSRQRIYQMIHEDD
jgi:transposase-like protein